MKSALILTYYWPPAGGSGVQRWLKFVKYLPEFGVQPYVLTVDPAKASYPVIDKSFLKEIPENLPVFITDTFEPYNLYKKLIGKGKYPHSSFDNESRPSFIQKVSRFIRGNFFIPDSRKGWKKYAVKKALELIAEHNIEIVITTGPPHSVHLAGYEIQKKIGIKWIADFRDPWTELVYNKDLFQTAAARKYNAKLEKRVIEKSSCIFIVSEALKQLLISKSESVDPDKIKVIPNGFDQKDFEIPSNPPKEKFLITFTGSLANSEKKMDVFTQTLSEVLNNNKDIPVKIKLIGNIDKSVCHVFDRNKLTPYLEIVPYVTHNESVKFLMNSTIVFLVIQRNKINKGILSGKLFDYIGSGKPILCIGPEDGNVNDVIKECDAGRVIDYENKNAFSEYLKELFNRWRDNKNLDHRNPLYLKYSRKSLAQEVGEIINNI